jgi:hypothetical protein
MFEESGPCHKLLVVLAFGEIQNDLLSTVPLEQLVDVEII